MVSDTGLCWDNFKISQVIYKFNDRDVHDVCWVIYGEGGIIKIGLNSRMFLPTCLVQQNKMRACLVFRYVLGI